LIKFLAISLESVAFDLLSYSGGSFECLGRWCMDGKVEEERVFEELMSLSY
jgi:hypothetical protein